MGKEKSLKHDWNWKNPLIKIPRKSSNISQEMYIFYFVHRRDFLMYSNSQMKSNLLFITIFSRSLFFVYFSLPPFVVQIQWKSFATVYITKIQIVFNFHYFVLCVILLFPSSHHHQDFSGSAFQKSVSLFPLLPYIQNTFPCHTFLAIFHTLPSF